MPTATREGASESLLPTILLIGHGGSGSKRDYSGETHESHCCPSRPSHPARNLIRTSRQKRRRPSQEELLNTGHIMIFRNTYSLILNIVPGSDFVSADLGSLR